MLLLIIANCYMVFLIVQSTAEVNYRLPKTLEPTRYDLELTPNFEDETFVGTVKIFVNTLEDTTNVTLHKRNLNITEDNIDIIYDNGNSYQSRSRTIIEDQEQEFFIMVFYPGVRKGSKYIITISNFVGKLNRERRGLHMGYFKNQNGELKKFVSTHFVPTNAREVFPCFDEPEYRAILNLKVNRLSETYITIANAEQNHSSSHALSDVFYSTLPMPTYLYSFIVSEMRLSDVYAKVRVLAKPQDLLINKHTYALEKSQVLLREMEEYLNMSYNLAKLDQTVVNGEGYANWGLNTFKESNLLTTKETDVNDRQLIVIAVASGIANQWFGNLVTPSWWTYIWLQTGFERFFGSYAANWAVPNMELMEQFVVKTMHDALYLDSLDTTRSMSLNVTNTDEIVSLFDGVAYDKTSSVIRMLEGILTKNLFKKCLSAYLDNMTFKNCTPIDLYQSIQSIIDNADIELWDPSLNITDVMSSWDSTPGYPVVNVIREYGVKENNIKLRQERFFLNNSLQQNGTWKIPINFYSTHYTNITIPSSWLTKTEDNVTYPYINDDDWLIANVKQTGFYRVNYDDTNWVLIANALSNQHETIDILNRAQIIDDTFNLARSGRLDYATAFQLSMYLKNETDYIAFYPFLRSVRFLNNMLQYTDVYSSFKSYVLNILNNIYMYLRFEHPNLVRHTDMLNRIQVLNWLCALGHEECRLLSSDLFKIWKNEEKPISVDLQSAVFCGAIRTGTEEDHAFLLSKLSDDPHLRSRIVNGLGCSENSEVLLKYLELSLNESSALSPNEILMSTYDKSPVGLQVTLDFLEINFGVIKTRCSDSVVKAIGEIISTETQFNQLRRIAGDNENDSLFMAALKSARSNIEWIKMRKSSISAALNILKSEGNSVHVYASTLLISALCLLSTTTLRNLLVPI